MTNRGPRKEIADLKSQQRYVDACKIGKGLELLGTDQAEEKGVGRTSKTDERLARVVPSSTEYLMGTRYLFL